ncbi:MAG: neutral/alkaline non-lysosomal ceramidase N-terminal domain-containing protein [Defluviitaleaceae bacterium]|nr:neutral/alkaline non-lysosomal ceramidase N-terminal domain-containing protein [Defluviitaleaceae bacterium]
MSLFAGVAREKITPEVGGFLFGYNDHTQSQAVHDDLRVTALALKSGDDSVLLLSAEVCLINEPLCEEIRKKASEATGIPHVILSATHTHSGPNTASFAGFGNFGNLDTEYIQSIFTPKCIAAAKAAAAAMKPVKMGVGTTESKVGINRRQLLRDNTVKLGQNPWDPYDSTMTVITFAGEDGKAVANLVHVGAHPTASGNNNEITRDWPGVMVDRMEAESGAMTLYVNGTQGDIAPRMANGDSVGDISHAMEVGGLAGIDAVRAYKTIRAFYDEPISVTYGELNLPYEPAIAKEDIPAMLESSAGYKRSSLERLAKLYEAGDLGPEAWTFPQIIVRVGPVVFVPYPFEVSTEIGLRLRNYSPYAHTLLLSCTNGSHSYLPAQSQICRGGYEIESFRWFRPRQLPPDADYRLVEQNIQLIEKL